MRRRAPLLLLASVSSLPRLAKPQLWRASASAAVPMPAITVLTTEDAADKARKVAEASQALATEVATEEVRSYYWWEGKVNFDPEWRVAVTTTEPFAAAEAAIAKVHSYDLPMIIYDLPEADASHRHWKGTLKLPEEEAVKLAETLVSQRIVACAQAGPSGLAVKTVARCKPLVEKTFGGGVTWSPIGGNEGYLQWLEAECVGCE
ncbi:unnamed protein product [Effrenium voratum]|nr:unnamed protein product [Effrenium voratum]